MVTRTFVTSFRVQTLVLTNMILLTFALVYIHNFQLHGPTSQKDYIERTGQLVKWIIHKRRLKRQCYPDVPLMERSALERCMYSRAVIVTEKPVYKGDVAVRKMPMLWNTMYVKARPHDTFLTANCLETLNCSMVRTIPTRTPNVDLSTDTTAFTLTSATSN